MPSKTDGSPAIARNAGILPLVAWGVSRSDRIRPLARVPPDSGRGEALDPKARSSSLEVQREARLALIGVAITLCGREGPLLNQLERRRVQLRPVRALHNRIVNFAVYADQAADHDVGLTHVSRIGLWHVDPESAAIGCAKTADLRVWRSGEDVGGGVG